jgi:arylsulfatase A-like enzyme
VTAPCVTSDYFPTILDALGIDLPADRAYDGASLLPFVLGQRKEREKPIGFLNREGKEAVWMTERHKLVSTGKADRLYDLLDDPSEKNDLAQAKPELAQKLKAELTAWKSEVMKELQEVTKKP